MDTQGPSCAHHHWEIRLTDGVGCGTCLDCEHELSLIHLFNGLRQRLEAAVERAERLEGRVESALWQLEQHLKSG